MEPDPNELTVPSETEPDTASLPYKECTRCKTTKPLSQFLRRTGRRSGKDSRRGTCKACRKVLKPNEKASKPPEPNTSAQEHQTLAPKRLIKRPLPAPPPKLGGPDASVLVPNRQGVLWMRGRTDKGRRWFQETDLETAATLVREHAAVVVNRHTVRRVYTNRSFRQYILQRDRHTCYFCGEFGDTIDHLLPRAKGGHTTPVNCVCACMLCNQSKADLSLDDFLLSHEGETE